MTCKKKNKQTKIRKDEKKYINRVDKIIEKKKGHKNDFQEKI